MEISEIDKNFEVLNTDVNGKLIKVPSDKVSLFGVRYIKDNGFCRMDPEVAKKTSEGVSYLNFHTSGGRVCFKTNSSVIKIHVTYPALEKMYHMPLTGQAGFSLNEVVKGKEIHIQTFSFTFEAANGYSSSTHDLDNGKMHSYVMYFPLYNKVSNLVIEIDKKARIKPYNPYKDIKPIYYYGSSITQGGCASRPDNSYQGFISRWNKIDFVNLGFSGNAKGEQSIADYLANIPMSVLVLDYDHNTPDAEYLRETHEKFFKTFREAQPETPVIFLSAPNYFFDPNNYEQRRQIIERTYLNAIKNGDKNVYFIDGRTIYPASEREFASVDDAHPNDLGFYFFAKRIQKILKNIKLK